MYRYLGKRLARALLTMWFVATVVFVIMRGLPGSPIYALAGQNSSEEVRAQLRSEFGLDQPLYVQYVDWLADITRLDLGQSIITGEPVVELLTTALPPTLSMTVLGMGIGLSVALTGGVVAATRHGEWLDRCITSGGFLLLSLPGFFIGVLLALVFGVQMGLFPTIGYAPLNQGILTWFHHLLLPSIAIGLPYGAALLQMQRSSLIDVLNRPYVQLARAKGVRRRVRIYKHALQNALLPVTTLAGLQLAGLLLGSVTVELVFGIQGLGQLVIDATLNRDYPIIQATVLLFAGLMVLTNLLVDLVYTRLDPTIDLNDSATT